jgi:hypothetical protein
MFVRSKKRIDISLYINEVMADNSTVFADENGMYSDWIELYYNGTSTVELSDFYMTDDLTNPFKYRMPNQTNGTLIMTSIPENLSYELVNSKGAIV